LLKSSVCLVCLCGFFLLGSRIASAQTQDWQSTDSDITLLHLPVKIATDFSHLFIDENIAPFAVGTAATALDWTLLDSQNSLASGLQNLNIQPIFNFGNFYGEGWVEGLGGISCWYFGTASGNLRLQEFGRDASESLIEAAILVTGLKNVVGRERPDGSNDQSFPSGHSIVAFSFAPVVQKYWGWGAGIAAYTLGTVTALARVEGYHHYLSDTIAGATLGIIIGNSVVYTPKDITVGVGPGEMEFKLAFN